MVTAASTLKNQINPINSVKQLIDSVKHVSVKSPAGQNELENNPQTHACYVYLE